MEASVAMSVKQIELLLMENLKKSFENNFFGYIESWDENSSMSALEAILDNCIIDTGMDMTEADEKTLDSLTFQHTWLTENERLGKLSSNLNERIENRGYFIEDFDGKGFYRSTLSLIKGKIKQLKKHASI